MELLISIFVLLGALFILVSAIGLVRFKDLYSRMHATTKASSFGIFLLLIGVNLFHQYPIVILKSVLILVFIYLTAPLAAHALSSSAFFGEKENKGDSQETDC